MQYDFTSILDRKGKDAIACESPGQPPFFPAFTIEKGFDLIPMWVADMNFPTAPSIVDAIVERAKHPAFGYFNPSEEYYKSILSWQAKRNHVEGLASEDIHYENGVLGGLVSALHVCCNPGDYVLLHSPTYIGFTHSILDAGYRIIHSPLKIDENGLATMDYEDMEKKIQQYHIHTAVFCSPHNPTGRVWSLSEIQQAMEVYRKNDVTVISDEIWSDLTLEGANHIPTQSISEDARMRTIALYAPSKTFNLAGLIGSYRIVYNPTLREKMDAYENSVMYNSMNVLSMHALIGAYSKDGEEWLDQLKGVLTTNRDYAIDHIHKNYPGVLACQPQGTYMLFLDCSKWCKEHSTTIDTVLMDGWKHGVIWQDGRPFQHENSIRMNLALPLSRVLEAFQRLDQYVFQK